MAKSVEVQIASEGREPCIVTISDDDGQLSLSCTCCDDLNSRCGHVRAVFLGNRAKLAHTAQIEQLTMALAIIGPQRRLEELAIRLDEIQNQPDRSVEAEVIEAMICEIKDQKDG